MNRALTEETSFGRVSPAPWKRSVNHWLGHRTKMTVEVVSGHADELLPTLGAVDFTVARAGRERQLDDTAYRSPEPPSHRRYIARSND